MLVLQFARTIVVVCIAVVASADARPPKPPPTSAYLQSAAAVAQSNVSRLLPNARGEVDGLLLSDGTQVQFPPHMTGELLAVIRPGDQVSVQGYRAYDLPVVTALAITNLGTQQSVIDHPPAAPGPPRFRFGQGLREMNAHGTVDRLLYGRRGEVNGVLLSDGSVVHFPPQAAFQLGALLQIGQRLSVSGYGTENEFGRALEGTSIGADGQTPQYLYRPGAPRG